MYQWVIDYITVQTVLDESNFKFELDYYCCDVLGIDQPFNFGGVLEDENGNAFKVKLMYYMVLVGQCGKDIMN